MGGTHRLRVTARISRLALIGDAHGHVAAAWNEVASGAWVARFDPDIRVWNAPQTFTDSGSLWSIGGTGNGDVLLTTFLGGQQFASRRFDAARGRWDDSTRASPAWSAPDDFDAAGNGVAIRAESHPGTLPSDDWSALSLERFRGGNGSDAGWQTPQPLSRVEGDHAAFVLSTSAITPDGRAILFWRGVTRGSDNLPVVVDSQITVSRPFAD